MSTPFRVEVAGDTAVDRELRRRTERSGDLRPVFDQIADLIAQVNRQTFESETSPVSGRWSPLSPPYRREKARKFPGRKINVRTGRLKEELTRRPFGYEQASEHEYQMGSALPYHRFIQHGTPIMPARPVEIDAATRVRMTKMVQKYLITGRT